MVKHIVMWKFDERADAEVARDRLEGMRGRVPSMLDIETGLDFNGSPAAYDLVLITSHADRDALQTYQDDPVHGEVKSFLGSLKSRRVVVDFEN